ncbi:MAG: hypothetical protein GC180_08940 [Bacteroidetes bacterium]|nr:hypothetical protein [Bacteroidota bacterium]
MEKTLRIVLPIVILGLIYLVYDSIARPIREQKKIDFIEGKIKTRLLEIKAAQFAYRDQKGTFANNFDSLTNALKDEKWRIIKTIGDPNSDSASEVSYDTLYVSLYEHAFPMKDVNLDSLAYVPMNPNGAKFEIEANIISINGTNVPVFQVTDPEPINKARALTLGDLSQPVYSGNWE